MTNLRSLSVGIFDLESLDFLGGLPVGITKLSLQATRSKKPKLAHLVRFHSLRQLYLEAQQQDIDVLSQLTELEELTLRSITVSDLGFLAGLPRLWSLDIKLGGTKDLAAIHGKQSIKYLELWLIRGLSEVEVLSSLSGLQYVFLQSLKNVRCIPDLSRLYYLRKIFMEDMKGLKDVSGIRSAPVLEELVHTTARNMEPNDYKDILAMPTLKKALVRFGSQRKNQAFDALAKQHGKIVPDELFFPFAFR
jgi:hypothetical protein